MATAAVGAGCLFTDENYVLAGFQEKDGKTVISGFGGKLEETDECEIDAAIRETLEELFHLKDVPASVVRYLMVHYIPRRQFKNGDYQVFIYNFFDLADWLHIIRGFGIDSELYDVFPKTLEDLILRRKIVAEAEIRQLLLVPIVPGLDVCPHFQSDLELLSKL